MSQQIRVLQCAECSLYQVDIVKKTNKWDCKVCRQKQVVLREFFRGTGAECRLKVQELNLERGLKRQAQDDHKILEVQQRQDSGFDSEVWSSHRPSKWAEFVDKPVRREPENIFGSQIATKLEDVSFTSEPASSSQRVKVPSKWDAILNESIKESQQSDCFKTNAYLQSPQLAKPRPSKWSAFVDEQLPEMRQKPQRMDQLGSNELPHNSTKRSSFNKRKSDDNSIANNKSFSKWQKFL